MNGNIIGGFIILGIIALILAWICIDLIRVTRRRRQTPAQATELPSWLDLDFHAKCKRKAAPGSNAVPCLLCAGPCWGDMLDAALDQRGTSGFAFVIERGSSPVDAPSYFSGIHWGMGLPQWSKNHLDAVRFANSEAAQRISDSFPPVKTHIPPHRVREHGWS